MTCDYRALGFRHITEFSSPLSSGLSARQLFRTELHGHHVCLSRDWSTVVVLITRTGAPLMQSFQNEADLFDVLKRVNHFSSIDLYLISASVVSCENYDSKCKRFATDVYYSQIGPASVLCISCGSGGGHVPIKNINVPPPLPLPPQLPTPTDPIDPITEIRRLESEFKSVLKSIQTENKDALKSAWQRMREAVRFAEDAVEEF